MARSLRPPLTGIGRYTLNLARDLAEQLSPGSLTLLLTSDAIPLDGLPCRRVPAPIPTPPELLRALWEQTLVPLDLKRRGIDVYHSPNYTLPFVLPCPAVLTVHDLAFLNPHFHNTRFHLYLRTAMEVSLPRAGHVIAVSEHTRQDLEARYPRVRGRVTVVYPGLDPAFLEQPDPSCVDEFRRRVADGRPYILFVGAIEPRKNLPRLVRAFEIAVGEAGLPHHLVLCGPLGWRYGPSVRAWRDSPLRHRIHHVGYVPAQDLPLWYAGADAFVYPSLFEGFGFPPLEAMACGTPVVTSNTSSLPEVVGDAALTVPPRSLRSIADAIQKVICDRDLAEELRQRGLERSRRFTWRDAAAATIQVYRRVSGG
jgi:glycosyltransferase involved in cell wall biosynthesis